MAHNAAAVPPFILPKLDLHQVSGLVLFVQVFRHMGNRLPELKDSHSWGRD